MIILYLALGHIDYSRKYALFSPKFIEELGAFAECLLPKKAKWLLIELGKQINELGLKATFSGFAHKLSNENNMPLSTIKWNLRKLIEMKLVCGGNGQNLSITELGQIILLSWRRRAFNG